MHEHQDRDQHEIHPEQVQLLSCARTGCPDALTSDVAYYFYGRPYHRGCLPLEAPKTMVRDSW